MAEADIGMAGLGVMGLNLARNMERNGYAVAVWNREADAVDEVLAQEGGGKGFTGTRAGGGGAPKGEGPEGGGGGGAWRRDRPGWEGYGEHAGGGGAPALRRPGRHGP